MNATATNVPVSTSPGPHRANRSLRRWGPLALFFLFVAGTVGTMWHLSQRAECLYQEFPIQGTALQAITLQELRKVYTEEVVERVQHKGVEIAHDGSDNPQAIPLPATLTMTLGERLNQYRPGAHIRLYSDYPFPWRKDGGARDDFERQALLALRDNPDEPYYRFEEFEGRPSLRYAIADRMQVRCVACHNSHPDSPRRDWQVGDVRGVLEVIRPLDDQVAAGTTAYRWGLGLTVAMSGLGLAGLGMVYRGWRQAQDKAEKARATAEAASRAKSEFLANMSHEIRTPMNGILGMTELALTTDLTGEQRDYLEMVKSSANALLTVINDILDFSKIEARKLELDAVEFNLRQCLEDGVRNLAIRAQAKGLELSCRIPPDLPETVVGDPGRLRQVLLNLVGNAVKFTDLGEVVVEAGFVPERMEAADSDPGLHLHIAVRDTGIGIPPQKQQQIFAAFTQADSSTARKYGGTGLGLSISSQLVEMMQGRMWVESEIGRGSTFHFTVRLAVAASHVSPPSPATVRIQGLPVLVVDDNATNRLILQETLRHWQMTPILADGGRAGLAELERAVTVGRPFPLVLLDSQMPEMDGFCLAERIRSSPCLAGATILMLTSDRRQQDVTRCRELGIASYLVKPITQSDLLEAIHKALGGSERPPAPAVANKIAAPGRSLRVLLAEDNAVNQRLATRMLEKEGHRVVIAADGRQAVDALDQHDFDVVLMDVQMPEMCGFEATARIRARERERNGSGRRVPIIALTAHAMKGDRERCLAAGMDGYVSKPIEAKELFRAIAAVVPAGSGSGPNVAVPAFNEEAALERTGGDRQLLGELIELFLADSPRLLAEGRAALAAGDAPALRRAAHTLKGSASNFGAEPTVAAALRLEKMAAAGDLGQAEDPLADLENAFVALRDALADYVTSLTISVPG